ncbi:MAG: HAD family hydrolase [Candidatus Heimdallarchaeota archaeon]|nr:HAD family hydrolase [Candidatus Heimdallarchaeota archaeon]
MSEIKAVIFDFDNTLVKSHIDFPSMKISMAQQAKKHGLDFGEEKEIPHKFTAGNIIEKVKEYDEQNGTNLASQLWNLVEKFEREGMEDLTIDSDVFSLLENLQNQGIILCLFTNNAKKPTLEVLQLHDMQKYFQIIVAREDVFQMKPDSEGIDLILKKLDLKPEQVILVGDSWVDGKAANNANVRFVLFREEKLDQEKYGIEIWKHTNSIIDVLSIFKEE